MRNSGNSKWLLPLVAGTELPARTGLTAPLPSLTPGPPLWALPGLVLWLDGASLSTLKLDPNAKLYRWVNRVGDGKDALQPNVDLRPTVSNTPLAPRSVNLG